MEQIVCGVWKPHATYLYELGWEKETLAKCHLPGPLLVRHWANIRKPLTAVNGLNCMSHGYLSHVVGICVRDLWGGFLILLSNQLSPPRVCQAINHLTLLCQTGVVSSWLPVFCLFIILFQQRVSLCVCCRFPLRSVWVLWAFIDLSSSARSTAVQGCKHRNVREVRVPKYNRIHRFFWGVFFQGQQSLSCPATCGRLNQTWVKHLQTIKRTDPVSHSA